jgi:ubiquinone/menaquinone biosynthesis C-methylase UbiE
MLEACATKMPRCQFTVLDQSEGMLVRARDRWRKSGGGQNITFECADARQWRGDAGAYDLVVTNFFLDCFGPGELHQVIANLGAAATPHAWWLVADFSVPPTGWRRARARAVLAAAYGFFRLTTGISANRIASPDPDLESGGFVLRQRERFNFGLLRADLWARGDKAFHHPRPAASSESE